MTTAVLDTPSKVTLSSNLEFLWLEITSLCNLQCVHCYAESSPHPEMKNILSPNDYFQLISEASRLGCKKVQFIGGEPTLAKHLPDYISHAHKEGFDFIEVFSNLFTISDQLITCFVDNKVSVATSFYCDIPEIHDEITQRSGSHSVTTANIKRILDAGLVLRAGIILMPPNQHRLEETKEFLYNLGVQEVGTDRLRGVGRGTYLESPEKACDLGELCGSCWKGSACVAPDGTVSPCIMSKEWSTGSILNAPLGEVFQSSEFYNIRQRIYEEVWLPLEETAAACNPDCSPTCVPQRVCSPTSCSPNKNCQPTAGCRPCSPYY
jgi:MoaA/NifB/PqqE/SkfB family radical SAM enzyme